MPAHVQTNLLRRDIVSSSKSACEVRCALEADGVGDVLYWNRGKTNEIVRRSSQAKMTHVGAEPSLMLKQPENCRPREPERVDHMLGRKLAVLQIGPYEVACIVEHDRASNSAFAPAQTGFLSKRGRD